MSFAPPQLNLLMSLWHRPNTPAAGPADVTSIPSQLYLRSRGSFFLTPSQNPPYWPTIILRTAWPRGVLLPTDIVEFPADDPGVYYYIAWSDPCHLGFPNVYTASLLVRCNAVGDAIGYS